jgi:hypothetical protein
LHCTLEDVRCPYARVRRSAPVLQNWGGAELVNAHKLWARVALVFQAPAGMTNRSSKMAQLWHDHCFGDLVGPQAEAAGVEQPRALRLGAHKKRITHCILEQWPGCLIVGAAPEKRRRGRGQQRGAFWLLMLAHSCLISKLVHTSAWSQVLLEVEQLHVPKFDCCPDSKGGAEVSNVTPICRGACTKATAEGQRAAHRVYPVCRRWHRH